MGFGAGFGSWTILSYPKSEAAFMYINIGFCSLVGAYVTYFLLFAIESLHITLAKGAQTISEGKLRGQVVNISSTGLRKELDNYIREAGGIENTTMATYLSRLTLTADSNSSIVENCIPLSDFTTRAAEKLFELAFEEGVSKHLESS
mmetsp:Transcript_49546/g.140334  ORF Transcript_49546/g.140334 Transcript_49546/m.140334 type:complete len:147 (+) Transcript_49546:1011-1451(+)